MTQELQNLKGKTSNAAHAHNLQMHHMKNMRRLNLQNLGYVNYSDSAGLFDGLQNLGYVNYSDSAGLFDGLQNLGLKFSDPWLMNLDADAQLMSLESNPANDPWRNGMTDYSLQNLITLQGAKDLYGKAKGTGLFNLEQDQDLQDLQMVLGRLQNLGGTGSWAL